MILSLWIFSSVSFFYLISHFILFSLVRRIHTPCHLFRWSRSVHQHRPPLLPMGPTGQAFTHTLSSSTSTALLVTNGQYSQSKYECVRRWRPQLGRYISICSPTTTSLLHLQIPISSHQSILLLLQPDLTHSGPFSYTTRHHQLSYT